MFMLMTISVFEMKIDDFDTIGSPIYSVTNKPLFIYNFTSIVRLKIDENRYKQKISTDPNFGCYSYAVFTTKF